MVAPSPGRMRSTVGAASTRGEFGWAADEAVQQVAAQAKHGCPIKRLRVSLQLHHQAMQQRLYKAGQEAGVGRPFQRLPAKSVSHVRAPLLVERSQSLAKIGPRFGLGEKRILQLREIGGDRLHQQL